MKKYYYAFVLIALFFLSIEGYKYYLSYKKSENNNRILTNLLDKSKKNYKKYLKNDSVITLSLNLKYLPPDIDGINESISYYNENLEYIDFLRKIDFKLVCDRFNVLTKDYLIENNLEKKEDFFVKKSSKNRFFSSNKHEQEILKYLDEHKILGINKWEKPCNFLKKELLTEKKKIVETLILLNKELIKIH